MNRGVATICLALFATAHFCCTPVRAGESEETAFFNDKVLPILKSRCYACHSHEAGKSKGGLVLDSQGALLKGGNSGPALVPREPDESRLIRAVRRIDDDLAMPPKESLPATEVQVLEQWVRAGAPDPRKPTDVLDPFQHIVQRAATHWSLTPLDPAEPPTNNNPGWRRNAIDDFVADRLHREGLAPAPDARPHELIRRIYFDLLGLPPDEMRVREFERDYARNADRALAQLVDKLLASAHYGERWGRHWLDLARYAEISGGASNRSRETRLLNAFTYRDYVIRALNNDKPFDRFIIEQLAADQIELDDPRDLAALGFLPVGSYEGTAQEIRAERIDTVGKVFLGLSIGCARCHDHKFDPISTADFYALDGVFASTQEVGVPHPKDSIGDFEACPVIVEVDDPELLAARDKAIAAARRAVAEYEEELWGPTEPEWRALTPTVWQILAMDRDEFGPLGDREYLRKHEIPKVLVDAWRKWMTTEQRRTRKDLHPLLEPWLTLSALPPERFEEQAAATLRAYAADPGAINPILLAALNAKPLRSKKDVARVYGDLFAEIDREWQADTTRAALPDPHREALRQVLYGEGMPPVRHADKWRNHFGNDPDRRRNQLLAAVAAAMFSHPGAPERAMLLRDDNLRDAHILIRGEPDQMGDKVARGFLTALGPAGNRIEFPRDRSGRLELAQAIADPHNPLTARVLVNRAWGHHFGRPLVESVDDFGLQTAAPVQRPLLDWLAATFMADGWSLKSLHRQMLLSRTYRQSAVQHPEYASHAAADPDNALLWRANVRRLDFESLRDAVLTTCGTLDATLYGRSVDILADLKSRRRSVYAWIDRPLQPLLSTFDVPDNSTTLGERHESTSSGQALFLMNSGLLDAQAATLLDHEEFRRRRSTAAKIKWLYRRLLLRQPSPAEISTVLRLLAEDSTDRGWTAFIQSLLMSNEFAYVL